MNATRAKQMAEPGISRAATQTLPTYTFICCDCMREERRCSQLIPEGWDMVEADCSGEPLVRCPDCLEAIERNHIEAHPSNAQTAAIDAFIASLKAPRPKSPVVTKDTVPARLPHLFLEKQSDGSFQIVMTPEGLMMRMYPLMLYFDADQAERTAHDLLTYAWLLRNPGAVPGAAA